jgi:hypothetical protein
MNESITFCFCRRSISGASRARNNTQVQVSIYISIYMQLCICAQLANFESHVEKIALRAHLAPTISFYLVEMK